MIEIDKRIFIETCKSSNTMAEAASKLNLYFSTFKRIAEKYKCYNPNPNPKGVYKGGGIDPVPLNEILKGLHPSYQTFKLKVRLMKKSIKTNQCEICGLSGEWMGKPLNMELDHIDGDRSNHLLNNLRIICPNCHAQTPTFTSKNRRSSVR